MEYENRYLFPLMQREAVIKEREYKRLIRQLRNTHHTLDEQRKMNQSLIEGVVGALNHALEAKDRFTQGHSERVSRLAAETAMHMGFPVQKCEEVRLAGLFHDIGKIGISDDILLKPGALTEEEYREVRLHPVYSHRILEPLGAFSAIKDAVLYHHENWDGSGYPAGISGTEIPIFASIIHVVDAFDAMTSRRSYREPMRASEALQELRNHKGTSFHPEVVDHFCQSRQLLPESSRMA